MKIPILFCALVPLLAFAGAEPPSVILFNVDDPG